MGQTRLYRQYNFNRMQIVSFHCMKILIDYDEKNDFFITQKKY